MFGRELREMREARGLTQAELAAKTGINQSQISEIESGKRNNLTIKNLQRVAEALGLRVELRTAPTTSQAADEAA